MFDRIKAILGHPSEDYIEKCWDDLVAKATAHPGHVFTRRVAPHSQMKVVVPREMVLPIQRDRRSA